MNEMRMVAVGRYTAHGEWLVCDPTFEDTWQAGVDNSIDATCESMDECDIVDAYELGRLDALDSKPYRPGQYEHMTQQVEYSCGYRDGESTLDLEGYLADLDWLRGGMS